MGQEDGQRGAGGTCPDDQRIVFHAGIVLSGYEPDPDPWIQCGRRAHEGRRCLYSQKLSPQAHLWISICQGQRARLGSNVGARKP